MLSGLTYGLATYGPIVSKTIIVYMMMGIPALWSAVRLSKDRIDTTDRILIEKSYALWPIVLGGVIAENGYNVFKKFSKIYEGALCLVATHAERAKQRKLVKKRKSTSQLLQEFDKKIKQIDANSVLRLPE